MEVKRERVKTRAPVTSLTVWALRSEGWSGRCRTALRWNHQPTAFASASMTRGNFRQKGAAECALWDGATPSVPLHRKGTVREPLSDTIREMPSLAAPECLQFQPVRLQCCQMRMWKHLRKSLLVINTQSKRHVEGQWKRKQTLSTWQHPSALFEVVKHGKELGCSKISKNMCSRRLPTDCSMCHTFDFLVSLKD